MSSGIQNTLAVSSLGSGSNGNAFLVEAGSLRLLIDVGVPIRTLLACLKLRGLGPADIDAVIVSHEHSDHIRALPNLLRRSSLPVLATRGTHAGLPDVADADRQIIRALEPIERDGLSITPIPVLHDAREPVGFHVEYGGASFTIMTDLGETTEVNAEFAARADHLIIESNYDESMLRSGSYPSYLKQRIRSSDGHLSNDECAEFLRDVLTVRTGGIWLCHLSENNNRPDLAVDASQRILRSVGHVREVKALPRYNGSIVTWHANEPRDFVHQAGFGF